MSEQRQAARHRWASTAIFVLLAATAACAGQVSGQAPAQPPQTPPASQSSPADKPEPHITPEQAKQLFALVDELIKFSSDESGLSIKSTVKRQLTTRNAVESYIRET